MYEHCFLAAGVSFSSGSAACLSAVPKGNSKGTKLCFSWETTPFGMERYGLPLYFVSPSKVSNNTARIRASKNRILFKRRHLSSLVYFGKRSLLLHILRSVIKIAIGLRKGLTDRRKWQRQHREIGLHLSEQASTLITLLSAVGAIKSETICIPGVAGYLHGNKSPRHYCRSSLTSYCCLFAVTC